MFYHSSFFLIEYAVFSDPVSISEFQQHMNHLRTKGLYRLQGKRGTPGPGLSQKKRYKQAYQNFINFKLALHF